MGSCVSLAWRQKAIEEVRVLCTGLFVTAVLARVIANMGFDERPIPILPTYLNAETLSFLFFVVRPKAEFQFDSI